MRQWRVSWLMWAQTWPAPYRTEKVHDDEAEARDQLAGLQSMLADHDVRPCDRHVWEPRLEVRETGDWEMAW